MYSYICIIDSNCSNGLIIKYNINIHQNIAPKYSKNSVIKLYDKSKEILILKKCLYTLDSLSLKNSQVKREK